MENRRKSFAKKIGQIPGTITYTGSKSNNTLFVEVFDYKSENYQEEEIKNIDNLTQFKLSETITWINLNGLNHIKIIEKLGNLYELHPLTIEDIANTYQRPKIDEYESYLFLVTKMLYYDSNFKIVSEQVSFVLGKNYVISFQESEGDVFEEVRNRIREKKGRIRNMHADYLLYSLLDAIIDNYFNIIETLSDKIENLEQELFSNQASDETSKNIQALKREILKVRKAIFPLREVIARIEKHESTLILKRTKTYFRDTYDHVIQVSENIDIYREMVWSLMDMYMTNISNKMNEVMKMLTIMASIFIPLTFIAGIYGMNFKYMPELEYKNGYFVVLGVMIVLFLGMLYYFKRKKWL